MQIAVKYQGYETEMNEDGEFKCPHYSVEIEPPCCTSRGSSGYIECGCGGNYSLYCPDCHNDDLTDDDAERIMENHLDRDAEDDCAD